MKEEGQKVKTLQGCTPARSMDACSSESRNNRFDEDRSVEVAHGRRRRVWSEVAGGCPRGRVMGGPAEEGSGPGLATERHGLHCFLRFSSACLLEAKECGPM